MNKKNIKKLLSPFFAIIVTMLLAFVSCNSNKGPQGEFGYDADYFMGLRLLAEGNEKEARTKFNTCIKRGTYYCGKKSAEALCSIGSVQDRNNAAIALCEKYDDSDSLLVAVTQLQSAEEYHKIIELTNKCDFSEEYNEIIRIRLEALKNRNDTRYESEVFKWFTSRKITNSHYKFYRDFYSHPDFSDDFDLNIENENRFYSPEQFVINYRIETFNGNFLYTYKYSKNILDYFDANLIPLKEEIASDIGKAYLYGNTKFVENAEYFEELAQKYQNTPVEFYFHFYAGRLFSKADLQYTHAQICFKKAMSCTQSPEKKDNALWYLLSSSLSSSLDYIINTIGTYSKEWFDPDYFDDFFDSLLLSLLTSGRWDDLQTIYKSIDGYASDETVAQYAYIYGRLAQEGVAHGTEESIKEAFERACNSGYSIYYKALAAYQLDLSEEELEKVLCMPYGKENIKPDLPTEKLLSGYAYFGFPELIYPEWERLYENGIAPKSSVYISNFLNECSNGKDDYYHQSLRIAAKMMSQNTEQIDREYLKQIYPKNYSDLIEELSQEYGTIPSTIYALVRSESFFNPNVSSHAGAIGLAQLMETTGSDIARKLRINDYSLLDPATNLEFGIFYIAELIGRCDDSILSAFFSYNAGITRVRRWKTNTIIDFGTKDKMPIDLFLETLPYAETRGYGRKIVSASIMYEWLYSDNPKEAFTNIIEILLEK